MSKFVILNFEDPDASYAGGAVKPFVTRKAKASSTPTIPANVTGSAGDTIRGVLIKAKKKETFFGRNVIHHYSCLEIIQSHKQGTLAKADVAKIQEDVASAEKVYIIMHGKPDDTDNGFGNNNVQAATWQELGQLALLLFPQRDKTHRISLVMCYGARTDQIRSNHVGQMSPGELKTSFAYKFFSSICQNRNVVLTACTGAVSTSASDGTNEVESEEWVCATLDIIDYKKDTAGRNQKKQVLEQAKNAYLTQGVGTKDEWAALNNDFYLDPSKPATNHYEQAIKTYLAQTQHLYNQLQAAKDTAARQHGGKSNLRKYGRIRYTYTGPGQLTIVNKYGDPNDPTIGEDYVLYSGPLL